MPKATISFKRAPSEELLALLKPGGFLSPLLDLRRESREPGGKDLDIHFRSPDYIHVYCGLTRVVALKRLRRTGNVKVEADKYYMEKYAKSELFREWKQNDPRFADKLRDYMRDLSVNPRHTTKEGRVQQQWSELTEPWIPFDREARLEYQSKQYRDNTRTYQEVEEAFQELLQNYEDCGNRRRNDRWVKPKKIAMKVDQLGIDPEGRLVLAELKDAEHGNESEICYSPFQLLQYVWEWQHALDATPHLLDQIQSLVNARVAVGLMQPPQSPLSGEIRATVCFGLDGRTAEVGRRYRRVLDIVNNHLPKSVDSIETWKLQENGMPVAL